jgi:hypothetical protein
VSWAMSQVDWIPRDHDGGKEHQQWWWCLNYGSLGYKNITSQICPSLAHQRQVIGGAHIRLGGACDERLVVFKVVVKKGDGGCLKTKHAITGELLQQ